MSFGARLGHYIAGRWGESIAKRILGILWRLSSHEQHVNDGVGIRLRSKHGIYPSWLVCGVVDGRRSSTYRLKTGGADGFCSHCYLSSSPHLSALDHADASR